MDISTKLNIILSVFGDRFNPDELTKLIGVDPTEIEIKGEKNEKYKSLKYKQTSWNYSTGYTETLDPDDLFKLIFEKFKDNAEKILAFSQKNQLDIKFFIVLKINHGQCPSLYFNNTFIDLTHKLNAEIDIDIYVTP